MLRQCWHSHVWGIDAAYNLVVRGDWVEIDQDQIPFGEVWISNTSGIVCQYQSPYTGWKDFHMPIGNFLGRKIDNSIYGWTNTNTSGQLMSFLGGGAGNPVQIPGKYIDYYVHEDTSGHNGNARMIDEDGNLFSWGRSKTTGNGSDITLSPVQIPGKWKKLVTGTLPGAIKDDGTLWIWNCYCGNTNWLTNGNDSCGFPIKIPGGWCCASILSMRAMFGVKANCSLFTWGGYDNAGVLGNGEYCSIQQSPTQIPGCWTCVVPVNNAIYGIKHDCTMWAWGANASLSGAPASSPVQIPGSWVEFSRINSSSAVIAKQTDGNWYGWRASAKMFGLPTFCIPGKTCADYFCTPTLLNPQFNNYYTTPQRTFYFNK